MLMNTDGLDILINASVKYPELNGIKYKTDEQIIAMKFALQGLGPEADLQELQTKLRKSFNVYHLLSGSQPQTFEIKTAEMEGVIFFKLYRDEGTLTDEEVDLYIQLFKNDYDPYLIKENIDIKTNDTYKQRLKKNLLHRIHRTKNCNSFWAFRQGGKVFVLNK